MDKLDLILERRLKETSTREEVKEFLLKELRENEDLKNTLEIIFTDEIEDLQLEVDKLTDRINYLEDEELWEE